MNRRNLIKAATSSLLLAQAGTPVHASEPAKLQRFVNAVPLSGGWIRVAVQHFIETMGQEAIIEEKFGANGLIAMKHVLDQTPERPTHLISTNSTGTLTFITRNDLGHDRRQHFKSIGLLYTVPMVLVTRKGGPKKLDEFIDYGLKNQGQQNYASPGVGSLPHLTGLMLEKELGIKAQHVPQTGPSIVQVLGGHVDFSFITLDSALPFKDSDKLNLVAVTSENRSRFLPNLAAFAEIQSRFISLGYVGLMTGKQTPDRTADALNAHLSRMLSSAEWQIKAGQHGVTSFGADSRQASEAWLDEDFRRWSRVWSSFARGGE